MPIIICEICHRDTIPDNDLCLQHQDELNYFAAQEYELPFVPDFVKELWVRQKKIELLG